MRYLKASLVCGALAASIAGLLYASGAFSPLNRTFFGETGAPALWAQWLANLVLAFGLAWTAIDINRAVFKWIVAAAALLEVLGLAWILHLYGVFWPPFTSIAGGVFATGFGLAYAHSEAGKRKRVVQQLFGDRISAKTFRALVESDQPLQLNGEVCEASVVVCEIFNHDVLAEALKPSDYVALTNEFLRAGAEVLVEAGGYLDECDGESLRAVFGAPLRDTNHAAAASMAAVLLGKRLEELCKQCIERWQVAPDYRIGVNSGEMIAAAYGSNRLGTFSVAGEPLEFCRRLCVANKFYGSRILLGPRAFQLTNGAVEVRPMELIRSRKGPGREEIYELLAPKDSLTDEEKERRDLFWKGVVLFREKRLDEAAAHFQSSLHIGDQHLEDAPARFYLERIEHARSGVQALDWDNAKF